MGAVKRLLRYLQPYTLLALLGPLFMCIEVGMDLLQPLIMQRIIDIGIANHDHRYVVNHGLLMLLCAAVGLAGGLGSSIFAARAAVNFATDVRQDVFKKMGQFSSTNADSFGTGKLITIATNDIATVQQALIMTLRVFVRGPLLFIGSVVIVWFTARQLFPILLVAIPILIGLIYYFSVKSSKLFAQVQAAMDRVNGKLQEMLAGIRVIKAFQRQDYEKSQFKAVNSQLKDRFLAAEKVSVSLMPLMNLVINMGIVVGLWLGALKVWEGSLQVGVILAFVNYLNIMMMGLMNSTRVLMLMARSFPSAQRIVQVLDTEIDIRDGGRPLSGRMIRGDVEFRQVNFSYSKNGEYVLRDISFSVRAGQRVGIIGPTGSGKSTLVKLIPRLYDPDSGAVYLDGINVKDYPLAELRAAVGFVPQKATLFSGTIADNLRFGKEKATTAEMERAAHTAAAMEFIEKLEGKFEHGLQQGGTNLSGGQKQRLSMARAFIREPRVLILDDSTSAVDALSEKAVQQALRREYPDTTVFIISSKISSVIDADLILVMDDGCIVGSGTHRQLLATNELYRAIYDSQMGTEVGVDEQPCIASQI